MAGGGRVNGGEGKKGCTAWKRGSCRAVEERRSTTSLRISTNSNERVLDSGMPSSPDVIPWSMKGKKERGGGGQEGKRRRRHWDGRRRQRLEEREARSILRRTTSTWAPAGSDADRKPEIEEKRRSETKAIRRESSRAWRREGRSGIGTREREQTLQRKMQNSSPFCRQFRSTFLFCCGNRRSTCHEKLYSRIIFIRPREDSG